MQPSIWKQLWQGWKRIAAKIAHVQGNLILSVIYFIIVTPIAVLFRLMGQDPLAVKTQKKASYWSQRTPIDSPDEFLKRQY